jgi:hypothetical protein
MCVLLWRSLARFIIVDELRKNSYRRRKIYDGFEKVVKKKLLPSISSEKNVCRLDFNGGIFLPHGDHFKSAEMCSKYFHLALKPIRTSACNVSSIIHALGTGVQC